MKISKEFDNYLCDRTSRGVHYHSLIGQELVSLEKRKVLPIVNLLDAVMNEHKKTNRKALDIVDEIKKIEQLLEEVGYEQDS